MMFFRANANLIRLGAFVLALGGAALVVRGESIRFSKPVVSIAAPSGIEDDAPPPESRRLSFDAPEFASPLPMPMPSIIVRRDRGDRGDEEDEDYRRLPYASRKEREEPFLRGNSRLQSSGAERSRQFEPPLGVDPFSFQQHSDSQRGLAPVTDLNWDARDKKVQKDGPLFGNSGALQRDERDAARPTMFSDDPGREVGVGKAFQPTTFSDLFGHRDSRMNEKQEPSQAMLDRRAAFEQMLNPSAGVAGRMPGSLEPVPSLGPALPVPGLGVPSIAPSKVVKAADPTEAFKLKHDRLRGPTVDDVNKKYSQPAPAAPQPAVESRFQTPLNRQPVTREFPSRRF
jgi:hypothetical protein